MVCCVRNIACILLCFRCCLPSAWTCKDCSFSRSTAPVWSWSASCGGRRCPPAGPVVPASCLRRRPRGRPTGLIAVRQHRQLMSSVPLHASRSHRNAQCAVACIAELQTADIRTMTVFLLCICVCLYCCLPLCIPSFYCLYGPPCCLK